MSYDNIRICRERDGFEVNVTDPEIVKANRERNKGGDCCAPSSDWKDPNVEYRFDNKEQVLKFLDKAMDIALPSDEYSSTFDKLAKEAQTT
jgi:hypothetical protein